MSAKTKTLTPSTEEWQAAVRRAADNLPPLTTIQRDRLATTLRKQR